MRAAAIAIAWSVLAAAVRADDSCLVRGRFLGHDGRPLAKARILPLVSGTRSTHLARDGRFAMNVPCGSARVLDVEGVQYQDMLVPVIPVAGQVLEFEARMRPLEWAERFDSVRVIGEFNGYSAETAVPMTRRKDGTWAVTITCQAESLRYQLLGVAKDGLPTAGTMADTFFIRTGRGMSSIRAGKQPVEVVFDSRRLPRSTRAPEIRFSDPHGPSASVYPLFEENTRQEDRMSRAYRAHVAAGGDRDSFRWDAAPYRRSIMSRIPGERDPLRRQYLVLIALRNGAASADTGFALRALNELPPESPVWGLSAGGPGGELWSIRRATHRDDLVGAYAEKGSVTNPDRDTRASFLATAISVAKDAGDKDRLGRYVTRMADEFRGTYYSDMVLKEHAPNRKIRPGEMAPDVALAALEDSSRVIRVSEFRGRHLLLDFWAVWCGPCRAEMPQLHKAWETYKDRGLTLVSVSFDHQRADVAAYRRDKWAMPWVHTFEPKGFAGEASAAFDVWGIPKPVLIGPDGAIVAAGEELRGDKLHQVLRRALGEPGKRK